MSKYGPNCPTGEPWPSDDELKLLKQKYPYEEGFFFVRSRFCCGALPIESKHGKALHVARDGTPLYEDRWDEAGPYDPKTRLAWVRRGKDAFQIDTSGKVVSGPVKAHGKGGPFVMQLH